MSALLPAAAAVAAVYKYKCVYMFRRFRRVLVDISIMVTCYASDVMDYDRRK
tara:strand:- start:223 stop:378 length:156 start_codon:yes stop_codon:yes gene_type:complete